MLIELVIVITEKNVLKPLTVNYVLFFQSEPENSNLVWKVSLITWKHLEGHSQFMGYWNCPVLPSLTKVSFYDAMGVDSLPVVLDMSFYCVRKGILDVSCVTYTSLCILLPHTYK